MTKTIQPFVSVAAAWTCVRICLLVIVGAAIGALTMVAGAGSGEPVSAQPVLRQAESSPAMQTQSYEGMITDTHCNAKHSAAIGLAAADCTRACVHGGEHFALVDADKLYILEGETEAVKRKAGQRARIVGSLSGDRISVSSVAENR